MKILRMGKFVIASEAKQSRVVRGCSGLLRRYAPRNDWSGVNVGNGMNDGGVEL
jgi:hypothetical protein